MTDIIRYDAQPGSDIRDVGRQMNAMARFTGCRVLCQFNRYTLMATPDQSHPTLREWEAAQWHSYFGGDR